MQKRLEFDGSIDGVNCENNRNIFLAKILYIYKAEEVKRAHRGNIRQKDVGVGV